MRINLIETDDRNEVLNKKVTNLSNSIYVEDSLEVHPREPYLLKGSLALPEIFFKTLFFKMMMLIGLMYYPQKQKI